MMAGGRPTATPTFIATLTANQAFVRLTATPVGPSKLMAVPGNGLAILSWIPPPGATSTTNYAIYEGTAPGGESTTPVPQSDITDCAASATAASCTVTGLANGNTYYFKVAVVYRPSFIALPPSPLSNEASAALIVPGAPTGLNAVPGNAEATLSWTAPASNGGPPVAGYDVYDATTPDFSASTEVTTTAGTSTTVSLANNTIYYFWVTAVNTIGPGPASNQAPTPLIVPGAPTGLNATTSNGQISLSWTAPAPNGGPPVTSYDVYKTSTPDFNADTLITTTASTSTSVTGPPTGTTYYLWVTAANTIGQSQPSNQAPATTSVAQIVPRAPTGLTAVPRNGQVSLSWTAPEPNGGPSVTSYDVYRATTPDFNARTLITNTTSTTATATRSPPSTTYYFWVTAANTIGQSGPSNRASAATPVAQIVPRAPTVLTAAAGDARVTLSWTAPAPNDGPPVTSYKVYDATTPDFAAGTLVTSTSSTRTTVTDLTNGITYYFWVTAANTDGPGPASNQASARPMMARPTLLIAILAAIAALAVAGAVTLVRRGRRRRPPSPRHVPPASDVRAVPGSRLPDEVNVREIGTEPTHTVLFEPDDGTTTTTIKEMT